eukprot:g5170.t1
MAATTDLSNLFTRSFSSLLGLRLSSRIVTFLFNLLIARELSPSVYGLAAFRLPLLNSTVLFLSREAFRRTSLRTAPTGNRKEAAIRVSGISLLPLIFGLIFTPLFTLYLFQTIEDPFSPLHWSLILENVIAVVIEILSEPLYIMGQVWLEIPLRAKIEGGAIFVKSCVTFLIIKFTNRNPALAFSDGQLLYAVVTLLGYTLLLPEVLSSVRSENKDRRKVLTLKSEDIRYSGVFFIQTCEKLVLAEGSKFVLISFQRLYDEGVYGLVSNLGSLFVRLILQPFEETAFTLFSTTNNLKMDKEDLKKQSELLKTLVHCVSLLGIFAVVFGPPSTMLFLHVLYSHKWSDTEAPFVLAWYCPYIALMAINGTTEAFVHAVMDERGLTQSNVFMLISAALHMILSGLLVSINGSIGLVCADCCNMIIRIICIRKHFSSSEVFQLSNWFPKVITVVTGMVIFVELSLVWRVIEYWTERLILQVLWYAVAVSGSLFVYLVMILKLDRGFIDSVKQLYSGSESKAKLS